MHLFCCRMCIAKIQYNAAGATNKNSVNFLNTEVAAYLTIDELKMGTRQVTTKLKNINDKNLCRQLIGFYRTLIFPLFHQQ